MMLDPANYDFIVLADEAPAPALRNKIDGLGCAANEDDLLRG
jgi:hypothetical protein